MSAARPLPRRIVVAGDGQLGALAAIALRKALPATDVVVIGTPPDPAAMADRIGTALPFTNRLHDRLGIDEPELVVRTGGSHRLVMRYFGFGGASQQGMAAYGAATDPKLKTAFAKEWGGGPRNAATRVPAGSIGEVLAQAGRFQPPSGEADSPLADLDYALRWNVPAYRDMLVQMAQQSGVQYVRGQIAAVQPDGMGGIAAVGVEGAGPIPADLFVDCTGSQADIHSRLEGVEQQDWEGHQPIRRLLFSKPGEAMLALEDRVTLKPEGWLAEYAGRDGRLSMLALAGEVTDEAAVAALGAEPHQLVALEPGRAAAPWTGNVVALGDAAARFEPLGWLNLDFAHRQLALLLELLPGREVDPRERAEFNRRSNLMADRARDLVASHYAAPAAAKLFGKLKRSEELDLALDQFARRSRLPFFEEMPLLVQEWAVLLQALGVDQGASALATSADPRDAERGAAMLAKKCEAALRAAPPYDAWLEKVLSSG
jgi:tryptophan halogenase